MKRSPRLSPKEYFRLWEFLNSAINRGEADGLERIRDKLRVLGHVACWKEHPDHPGSRCRVRCEHDGKHEALLESGKLIQWT